MFLIEERKKHKQTKAPTEDCLPQYTVIFSVPVSDPGLFRGHGQNRFPTTLQLLFELYSTSKVIFAVRFQKHLSVVTNT